MRNFLEKRDIPAYVANLIKIAELSGNADGDEPFVLQAIFDRIGADESDLAIARKMLERGHNKLYVPTANQSRMDNLQDMIMIALADGIITPLESEPIEKFARAMKYSQADIDLALRRAKGGLHKITQRHSSAQLRKDSHDSRKRVIITAPPPLPQPDPVEPDDGIVVADESLPEPAELDAIEQAGAVAAEAVPPETTPPPLEESDLWTECKHHRESSDDPESYCFGLPEGPFNPWGCRLSRMTWLAGTNWMKLGHFRDYATFVFDKKSIANLLSANLDAALGCPYLATAYTEAAFDCLPQRVRLGVRWDYSVVNHASADAVRLTVPHYIHGCRVKRSLNVDGVVPIGAREALKIVHRALRKIGSDDNLYHHLKSKADKLA
jgi:hypothetical protein